MSNVGLRILCESLTTCPLVNLKTLRIFWNSINSVGIKHFSQAISLGVFDSLQVLDLSSFRSQNQ